MVGVLNQQKLRVSRPKMGSGHSLLHDVAVAGQRQISLVHPEHPPRHTCSVQCVPIRCVDSKLRQFFSQARGQFLDGGFRVGLKFGDEWLDCNRSAESGRPKVISVLSGSLDQGGNRELTA